MTAIEVLGVAEVTIRIFKPGGAGRKLVTKVVRGARFTDGSDVNELQG